MFCMILYYIYILFKYLQSKIKSYYYLFLVLLTNNNNNMDKINRNSNF
jgi:hypothetical protein